MHKERQPSATSRNMPLELFHLFEGQPQCAMVEDVYVADKHLHKEIEMVYVLSGSVDVQVQDRVFALREGELLSIRGSVLHQYLRKQPGASIAKLKFMKEWLLPPFMLPHQREAYQHLVDQVFHTRADNTVHQIIAGMLDAQLSEYQPFYCHGMQIALMAHLLSHPDLIVARMDIQRKSQWYLDQALSFLQSHCHERLTLKMLADHLGLAESYCSKYLKGATGITFVEYVSAMRVNNAQRLLIYTDASITDIASQTGFSSVQTFNRAFKTHTGRSPSEYRHALFDKEP